MGESAAGGGTPAWTSADHPVRVMLLAQKHRLLTDELVSQVTELVEATGELVLCDLEGEADLSQVEADFGIVLGGDGSMLRAARQMGEQQVPVLGINLGKLGFLADIQPEEIAGVLPEVLQGNARVINHLMFRCDVVRDGQQLMTRLGLNETAVLGGPPFALMDVELHIDEEHVTTYQCDGLIVSTPVGSTAHNLSAGGPILRKDLEAFVISAVSPHALTVRPVVDTADRCYELRATNSSHAPHVVIDGVEIHQLASHDRVLIRRAEPIFQLIEVPGHGYYRTLREKLGWAGRMHSKRVDPSS
jgi:NAD+ kinase